MEGREHRPGVNTPQTWCKHPISHPTAAVEGGKNKKKKKKTKPCVALNVDQKKSGVQIRVGKIENLKSLSPWKLLLVEALLHS